MSESASIQSRARPCPDGFTFLAQRAKRPNRLRAILERRRFSGHIISRRLYCDPKALWKFTWFLRDFGYEVELLGRDEVDETQLIGRTGVVKIGNVILS